MSKTLITLDNLKKFKSEFVTKNDARYELKFPTDGSNDDVIKKTSDGVAWDKASNLISFNTTYNASTNKAATMSDVNSAIASAYKYKGSVATYSALPTTNLTVGDIYNIVNADSANNILAGDNVAWNGTSWDRLAGFIDTSVFALSADLATVATSGSYNDLSNKPFIPTITDTYSSTSTNGMSGKAVSSAISTATIEQSQVTGLADALANAGEDNVIEVVEVGGTALTVDSKTVNIEIADDDDVDEIFKNVGFTWSDGTVTKITYATEGTLISSDVPSDS